MTERKRKQRAAAKALRKLRNRCLYVQSQPRK